MHQIIQHLKDSLKSICALRLSHREISQVVRADVRCSASSIFPVSPFLKTEGYTEIFLKLQSIGEGNYFATFLQPECFCVKLWYEIRFKFKER